MNLLLLMTLLVKLGQLLADKARYSELYDLYESSTPNAVIREIMKEALISIWPRKIQNQVVQGD